LKIKAIKGEGLSIKGNQMVANGHTNFDVLKFSLMLTTQHNALGNEYSIMHWGLNPTNSVVIPQSVVLRSIVIL